VNQTVPNFHAEGRRGLPLPVRAIALMWGITSPSRQEWDRMGESLTVGDAAMDELLAWMRSSGISQTRPMFEQAMTEGVANLADAPEPLRAFFAQVEATPDWVDWDKVRRGQRVLRAGGADGVYLARDVSLLGGYQLSGPNRTLLRTGALRKGSNARFAETLQWALDVATDGGLEPQGVGYRSTLQVRLIHAFVRSHVSGMPDWNHEEWGLPVNQTDMAATLLGTLIAPPLAGFGMGIIFPPKDLDAVAHLARYVGWLIGLEEQWLPHTFRGGVSGLYNAVAALAAPDETSPLLAAPMVDDPLSWNYETAPGLRRKLARAQHLSISAAFLGPSAMRALGLPAFALPWYPLLRIPINGTRSIAAALIPGGQDRAASRGSREQHEFLRTLVGSKPTIGQSAPKVTDAA